MFTPRRTDDGGLLVPHGTVDPDTGANVDGTVTVYPADDLYDAWLPIVQAQESAEPLTG